MKKFVLCLFMIVSAFGLFAEIRYEQKDNEYECIITYKNDNLKAVNIIGSMTDDWTEPGVPMTILANQTSTINTEGDRQILQRHIVYHIVICSLHKRRVDITYRMHTSRSQTRRERQIGRAHV